MSNLQLKFGIKNDTEATLNLLSNIVGNSNDETNFQHKLLLTDKQVSKIRKAFGNGSSSNIKFSKIQLSKMIHFGGFLAHILTTIPNLAKVATEDIKI